LENPLVFAVSTSPKENTSNHHGPNLLHFKLKIFWGGKENIYISIKKLIQTACLLFSVLLDQDPYYI